MASTTFVLKEPNSKDNTLVYMLFRYHNQLFKYSTVAEYLFFIEEYIVSWENENEQIKNSETTIKQQILMLFYLNNRKSTLGDLKESGFIAEFLHVLLNKNLQDIRKCLSVIHINDGVNKHIKTKENLEFVRNLFEKLKLTEQVKMIESDLKKLK